MTGGSGSRCDFLVALFRTRATSPAPRASLDHFRAFALVLRYGSDCRRQSFERNSLVIAAALLAVAVAAVILVAIVTAVTARTLLAICTLALGSTLLPSGALRTLIVALILAAFGVNQLLFAFILVAIFAALAALVLEAGAALAEHTVIMVGELEEIFGLDPVPSKLGVARHVLIFLEQLGSIAALTIVRAVAGLSPDILASLPPATATAATLTIIDQIQTSLTKKKLPLSLQTGRAALAALTSRSGLRLVSAKRTADGVGGGAGCAQLPQGSGTRS